MKKEKYERSEMEMIVFQTQDVIMISNPEEDELPISSGNNN